MDQIKNWYKKLGLLHFLLSIASLFFSDFQMDVRILNFVVANLGYHMMYKFITKGTQMQMNHVRSSDKMFPLALKGLNFFSYVFIVAGGLAFLNYVFGSIVMGRYSMLFFSLVAVSITLGGLYLRKNVQKEKASAEGKRL